MTWITVGVAGGGALLGAYQHKVSADAAQRQQKAQMMANAAQIQYSPWTHAGVQVQGDTAPDPNSAAIQGALQGGVAGALMGSQFKGKPEAALPADKAAVSTASQSPAFAMDTTQGADDYGNPYLQMRKPSMYGSTF